MSIYSMIVDLAIVLGFLGGLCLWIGLELADNPPKAWRKRSKIDLP